MGVFTAFTRIASSISDFLPSSKFTPILGNIE